MGNNRLLKVVKNIIWNIVRLVILFPLLTVPLMILDTMSGFNESCWYRYERDADGALVTSVLSRSGEFKLKGNANYVNQRVDASDPSTPIEYRVDAAGNRIPILSRPDPTRYGEWLNIGDASSEPTYLEIEGEVSLCKSYIPKYDLQNNRADFPAVGEIEIPRYGSSDFFTFIADSKTTTKWRNLAEVYLGDKIRVFISPPVNEVNTTDVNSVVIRDSFSSASGGMAPVDCNRSNTGSIAPACGRFTYQQPVEYITACNYFLDRGCGTVQAYDCDWWGWLTKKCRKKNRTQCPVEYRGVPGQCHIINKCSRDKIRNPNEGYREIDSFNIIRGNLPIKYEYNDSRTFNKSQFVDNTTVPTDSDPVFTYADFPTSNRYNVGIDCSALLAEEKINVRSRGYSGALNTEEAESLLRDAIEERVSQTVNAYDSWLVYGNGFGYRFTDDTGVPTNYNLAELKFKMPFENPNIQDAPGKLILDTVRVMAEDGFAGPVGMLQGGFLYDPDIGDARYNNGGYLVSVQHSKCVRSNGKISTDSFENRGAVEYYIVPTECDFNQMMAYRNCTTGDYPMCRSDAFHEDYNGRCKTIDIASLPHGVVDFSRGTSASINVSESELLSLGASKIWMRIKNNPVDYKDSEGEYTFTTSVKENVGLFSGKVMLPIFKKVDEIIKKSGEIVFKNLTCYKSESGKCRDFFLYIRAVLTLYIMYVAAMFLLGKSEFNQRELIIHVIKIMVISGLITGSTFEFFRDYLYPIVMNFAQEIMSNFGGYSNENPFTFLDEAFSKILLNKLTFFQALSIISTGLSGIVFMLIAIVALILFVIAGMQAIAAFVFAKLIIAFLMGIAPIFLIFMLFQPTRMFFQGWLNTLFRYIVEPIILVVGLSILSKLFLLYFDNVFSFSVCFKCAIPFRIPNIIAIFIPGLPEDLRNIFVFCIYWFGPWGIDSRLGLVGIPVIDVVGLFFVGYMCYTYIIMSSQLVSNLMNSTGPAAGAMGAGAGSAIMKPLTEPVRRKIDETKRDIRRKLRLAKIELKEKIKKKDDEPSTVAAKREKLENEREMEDPDAQTDNVSGVEDKGKEKDSSGGDVSVRPGVSTTDISASGDVSSGASVNGSMGSKASKDTPKDGESGAGSGSGGGEGDASEKIRATGTGEGAKKPEGETEKPKGTSDLKKRKKSFAPERSRSTDKYRRDASSSSSSSSTGDTSASSSDGQEGGGSDKDK